MLWNVNSCLRRCQSQVNTATSLLIFLPLSYYHHNPHEQIWALVFTMTHGKSLSDDLREVILNMACSLDIERIINYTGCKRRTIERIIRLPAKRDSHSKQPCRYYVAWPEKELERKGCSGKTQQCVHCKFVT